MTKRMEAYHGHQTYSKKTGSKREPKKVFPAIYYHKNQEQLTDKQTELYLIQHKIMHEFLDRKGLIQDFNQFMKKKEIESGDLPDWFIKWN